MIVPASSNELDVSIDAAYPETYRRVRRGGTLAILHDNGIGAAFHPQAGEEGREAVPFGPSGFSAMEKGELHCVAGEENIKGFPFLADAAGVIKYHHENYDGSGYFRLQGAAIPLKSQLIRLADLVELGSDLRGIDYEGKVALYALLERHSGAVLAPDLIEGFREASSYPAFWLDLKDEFIAGALHRRAPQFGVHMDWDEIRDVTAIFSRIIDSKSRFTRLHSQELSERAGRMGLRYRMDAPSIAEFRTAADLHDIGKLAVSNAILDKPGALGPPEIDVIQRHTYYTRVSLQSIEGNLGPDQATESIQQDLALLARLVERPIRIRRRSTSRRWPYRTGQGA